MAEGTGDYFISDVGDAGEEDDDLLITPVILPDFQPPAAPAPGPAAPPAQPQPPAPAPAQPAPPVAPQAPVEQAPAYRPAEPQPAPVFPEAPQPRVTMPAAPLAPPQPVPPVGSRESRLAEELDRFMESEPDVQASALVSLDGFTMASALPPGMQEDRVGAMSAAILGLGERAAAELGRGKLSEVFIEGEQGYVLLMAAGERAVLTVLARHEAKLGLLLYDMKSVAARIGAILA